MNQMVVTRFAPSPTGNFHLGGARTAIFNYLYARSHNGRFMLRIEDTDRVRSTAASTELIFRSLAWLGLDYDGEVTYQSQRIERHQEVAHHLLAENQAYHCYATPEELEAMRAKASAAGKPLRYDGRWRDKDPSTAPTGIPPVIRLRAPQVGKIELDDLVQGRVTVDHQELDDFILLRADGTPTYMLSVVVDDHDMGISHVIRGDDHLSNAFRQTALYCACGYDVPIFAHLPLIHGADGAKLSKRHGAQSVEAWKEAGILAEALFNQLLRLGWSHGDDEFITREQAIKWFDLAQVGRSAARFDPQKLQWLNGQHMRAADGSRLFEELRKILPPLDDPARTRVLRAMDSMKTRTRNLRELADMSLIYVKTPDLRQVTDKVKCAIQEAPVGLFDQVCAILVEVEGFKEETLEPVLRGFAEKRHLGFGKLAKPLRAALTGRNESPGLFEVMGALGREECLLRIGAARNFKDLATQDPASSAR